ncbi:MAG: TolB family protein, partial [Actinomycetota bacterium]
PDTSKAELGHWWPQLLPDGKHLLFTAYRVPIEQATIEVVSLESGRRQVVVTGAVFGRYVSTGHLLYAVNETIRAIPFDLNRFVVTGVAVNVVDSVAMNPSDGAAAFDVSENGTLAYLPVSSFAPELDLVLVDRRGNERLALPTADRYDNPRLSPDGGRIVVDIQSAVAPGDIWVFQIGRSSGTRITSGGGRNWGAEWTPDGQDLLYISERPLFEIYRRASDGSRPAEPLVTREYDHVTGAVSQDGRFLAFVLSVRGAAELWTVPLRGEPTPTRFLANGFNLAHPTLSPDGRWMAYDSDESSRVEVYMQSFPDPTIRRWKVSAAGGSEPIWTRGGRELVFRRGDSVMAVTVDLGSGQSGQPVPLFGGPYSDSPGWRKPRSYDASRDGERFLMLKLPPARTPRRVHVVLNWFEELERRVPVGR